MSQVIAIAIGTVTASLLYWLVGRNDAPFRLWLVLMVLTAALLPPRDLRQEGPGLPRQLFLIDRALVALLCVGASVPLAWWIMGLEAAPPFFVGLVLLNGLVASWLVGLAGQSAGRRAKRCRFAVYGAGEVGIEVARTLARTAPHVEIVGFFDEAGSAYRPLPYPLLGLPNGQDTALPFLDGVVIALAGADVAQIESIRQSLHDKAALILLAPSHATIGLRDARACRVGSLSFCLIGTGQLAARDQLVKRLLDILVASLSLLVALPVLAICALAIKLESPGPVIYRQRRYTTQMRLFDCYKLRTMRHDPQQPGIELAQRNDARVTRVGRVLRRTSVDEIPQFINVLQGHMSVVGPRPHPPGVKAGNRLYEEIVPDFFERYRVKPGITGWAQVSGLRGNTFEPAHLEQRFRYDLEYITQWSLAFELLIIAKTVFGGFGGRNAF